MVTCNMKHMTVYSSRPTQPLAPRLTIRTTIGASVSHHIHLRKTGTVKRKGAGQEMVEEVWEGEQGVRTDLSAEVDQGGQDVTV